jgi:hypothetical protein
VAQGSAVRRVAVYFNEEISQGEIEQIMRDSGLHIRSDGHRLVVDRVPAFLRHDEAEVIPMAKAKRRRA